MEQKIYATRAGQFTLKAHKNKAEAVALISIGKGRGTAAPGTGNTRVVNAAALVRGRLEKGLRQRQAREGKGGEETALH